jgi:hypothetical protein
MSAHSAKQTRRVNAFGGERGRFGANSGAVEERNQKKAAVDRQMAPRWVRGGRRVGRRWRSRRWPGVCGKLTGSGREMGRRWAQDKTWDKILSVVPFETCRIVATVLALQNFGLKRTDEAAILGQHGT